MTASPPPSPRRAPAGDTPPAMHWAAQHERSNLPILRFMTWLSLTLGRRLSRVVLYGIAAYFVAFSPKARRASKAYLRRVLGREPRLREGYRHVLSFASVIHDRVYWLSDRADVFDVEVVGDADVLALRGTDPAAPRGIVFVGAHLGSFEALRVLGDLHGLNASMLMYPDNAQKINAVLAAINPRLLDRTIALGRPDSLLRVRDRLAAGECVGALADRRLGTEAGLVHDFLGTPAHFPLGPFRMAAMLKAPVVFMAGLYLGGRRYQVRLAPVIDFGSVPLAGREAAIAQAQRAYVAHLAAACHAAPYNWFNFYDFWHDAQ